MRASTTAELNVHLHDGDELVIGEPERFRYGDHVEWITMLFGAVEVTLFTRGDTARALADQFYQAALAIRSIIGEDPTSEGPGAEHVTEQTIATSTVTP